VDGWTDFALVFIIFMRSFCIWQLYLLTFHKEFRGPQLILNFTTIICLSLFIYTRCDSAYGMKYVCLRYFNACGAHASGEIGEDHHPETHLIPLVLQVPLGKREKVVIYGSDYETRDGTCVRDYVHVTDLAHAHIKVH
jgi:hypothetical protein